MKNFFNKLKLNIPENLKKSFNKELIRSNYEKLSIVSIVFFAVELFIYILPESSFAYNTEISLFLISNIILIPLILYIRKHLYNNNLGLAVIVQNAYSLAVLMFGIFMALKYQGKIDFVHIYLMSAMAVACFLYFPLLNRLAIFISAYLLFVFLLPYYQSDTNAVAVIAINAFIFNLLTLILADMRIRSKLASFINVKKLETLASTDSMTGLYNHEVVLEKLSEHIQAAKIQGNRLFLFMMDVDNFKEINDKYGHLMGDSIIKEIAEVIKSNTPEDCIIGRYGGDEFVIISPHIDCKQAGDMVLRLREAIKNLSIPIYISIGLCEYEGESLNDFIKRTDNKLYEEKRSK